MVKVLLVDDDPSLLEIGKIFIEKNGDFSVDTALSAKDALEKLSAGNYLSYDAVVSDYEMPSKNGVDLLRDIRSVGSEIPFLIFTGKGREEIVIEALESGVDYYVQKGGAPGPQFAELTSKIKKAVEKKKSDEDHFLDSQRLEAVNRILGMKDFTFEDIVRNTVSESVRLTKSSFGYVVIFDGSDHPKNIFCNKDGDISKTTVLSCNECCKEGNTGFFDKLISFGSCMTVNEAADRDEIILPLCSVGFSSVLRYMGIPLYEDKKTVIFVCVANKSAPYDDSDRRQLYLLLNSMWAVAVRKKTEEELIEANKKLADANDMLKKSQKKLSESEESLSLAIDGAGLGIWDSDIATRRQVVNDNWAEMIGYTRGEVDNVLNFWRDNVHPADLPAALKCIDDYSKGLRDNYNVEFRLRCKDGRWKWIASTGKISARGPDNRPLRISGIHRDITYIVRSEKNLSAARKKLKMLLDIIRRDVMNQALLISENSKLLNSAFSQNPEMQGYISSISCSASAIENHLKFAFEYLDESLNEPVWQNACDMVERIAEEKKCIPVKCEENVSRLNLLVGPLLFIVFSSIFEDSCKNSENATAIHLDFEEYEGFGKLIVSESGAVIPDDEKELIFNKGFDKKEDFRLYFAREILSACSIEIRETGENKKGAKFEIIIPDDLYYIERN
ncbi:PAS domain S-box-containing protein [Methanomicrobium sp. W14]|uniref:PAS domain-containing protein n=1 Tax=Methanomicrobium sp. W14 TaxID=2817839 RepID=UPI001AE788D8|nr:PAS domain-containing protein [Methanomicrobium sp. W14]MBP2133851.1 PAS domain S-box-containing protein [Methanomicrobium sp. W14]